MRIINIAKNLIFFHEECSYTDDSVMTLAVAKSFLESNEDFNNLEEQVYNNQKNRKI